MAVTHGSVFGLLKLRFQHLHPLSRRTQPLLHLGQLATEVSIIFYLRKTNSHCKADKEKSKELTDQLLLDFFQGADLLLLRKRSIVVFRVLTHRRLAHARLKILHEELAEIVQLLQFYSRDIFQALNKN